MRKVVTIIVVSLLLAVSSLTGLAYCWQHTLDTVGLIVGFAASLAVLLTTAVVSIILVGSWAAHRIDEYIRDVTSASIQVARETAEETVESIPENIVTGIEKTLQKTRDRFFSERKYTPPWKRKGSQQQKAAGPNSQPSQNTEGTSETSPPKGKYIYDKAETYRKMIDDAIGQFRDKRKGSG